MAAPTAASVWDVDTHVEPITVETVTEPRAARDPNPSVRASRAEPMPARTTPISHHVAPEGLHPATPGTREAATARPTADTVRP